MIRFECQHCGRKLKVPPTMAGREGRCPACKGRMTVPRLSAPESTVAPDIQFIPVDAAKVTPEPVQDQDVAAQVEEAKQRERQLLQSLGIETKPEYTGQRKLPWPIDIWLYPVNCAGLASLAVIVGVPILLGLLSLVLLVIPPVGLLFWIAHALVALYAAWYFAECAYDSAMGGTRAPQALDTGGTSEMWSRVSYLIAVYIVYLLPPVIYQIVISGFEIRGPRFEIISWALVGYTLVFFPMGLLAMILHDSISALNPFFLLGSILRVFFPYVAFVILLGAAIVGLAWLGASSVPAHIASVVLGPYCSLILAHLLGRFYWRYRERLDWGI